MPTSYSTDYIGTEFKGLHKYRVKNLEVGEYEQANFYDIDFALISNQGKKKFKYQRKSYLRYRNG